MSGKFYDKSSKSAGTEPLQSVNSTPFGSVYVIFLLKSILKIKDFSNKIEIRKETTMKPERKQQSNEMQSSTPYDDVFRTMMVDCPQLLLPILNEIFGKNYTGNEKIVFNQNEHFINQQDGVEEKRITDSSFTVIGETEDKYLLECQAVADNTLLIRIFEYITQDALDHSEISGNKLIVTIPQAAILFLRSGKNTPDEMEVEIRTPGGDVSFKIPVMKSQKYSIDEIFEKKLYFLIPFVIFSYEKRFKKYNENTEELANLLNDYTILMNRLMDAEETKQISAYSWNMIRDMSKKVLENIANKYKNVKEGVEAIMGGRVLEYEGKRIFNEGRNKGFDEGRNKGFDEGKKNIAINLYRAGIPVENIAKYAEVSVDQVEKWISSEELEQEPLAA